MLLVWYYLNGDSLVYISGASMVLCRSNVLYGIDLTGYVPIIFSVLLREIALAQAISPILLPISP